MPACPISGLLNDDIKYRSDIWNVPEKSGVTLDYAIINWINQ